MDLSRLQIKQSSLISELDKEEFNFKRQAEHTTRIVTGFESLARQRYESGHAVMGPEEAYALGAIKALDKGLPFDDDINLFLSYGMDLFKSKVKNWLNLTQEVIGDKHIDQLPLKGHATVLDEQCRRLARLKLLTTTEALQKAPITLTDQDRVDIDTIPQSVLYHVKRNANKPIYTYHERKDQLRFSTSAAVINNRLNNPQQKTLDLTNKIEISSLCSKDTRLFDFILRTSEAALKTALSQYLHFLETKWGVLKTYPKLQTLRMVLKDHYHPEIPLDNYRNVINLAHDISELKSCITSNIGRLKSCLKESVGRGYDVIDCEEISLYVCAISHQTNVVIRIRNLLKKLQSVAQLQLTKFEIVRDLTRLNSL